MGTEAKLHAAKPPSTEAAVAGEGLALGDPLARLVVEATLVERVLAQIDEQRAQARAALERLERCSAGMDEAGRGSSQAPLAAEAAVLESRLTRLRVAASLAKAFARLRAAEAETLEGAGRRSNAATAMNDAAPDSHVVKAEAADPTEERRLRRAS